MTAIDLAESATGDRGLQDTRRRDLRSASALFVAAVTLIGFAIRLVIAHQSLFGDELSTYWIVTTHGLGGVISAVYSNDEITPPLYFVASWLTAHVSHAPALIRAPSLLAGSLTIPAVYLLGLRTVGRRAALFAAAFTALSPFMIYYSSEARAYAVMMLLVVLSTLSMLRALDSGRTRWWVFYGACSCAAFYTHYTCAFYLAAQLVWLLWTHPHARRAALLSNLGAGAAVLPWTGGLINDFTSPTTKITSALSPFTPDDVRLYLEHFSLGYPYTWAGRLPDLPGRPALVMLALAALIVLAGIAIRARRGHVRSLLARVHRRVALALVLLLSVPVGEALVSTLSTHLFGVRNLAASWPALALCTGALLAAAGPRLRVAALGLTLVALTLGALKMPSDRFARPNYRAGAAFIEHHAAAGDVVIDETGPLSPGPLTGLDVALKKRLPVFRAGVPQERDHPFGFADQIVPLSSAINEAVAAAAGRRVFVLATLVRGEIAGPLSRVAPLVARFPAHYHLLRRQLYPGIAGTQVTVYGARGSSSG